MQTIKLISPCLGPGIFFFFPGFAFNSQDSRLFGIVNSVDYGSFKAAPQFGILKYLNFQTRSSRLFIFFYLFKNGGRIEQKGKRTHGHGQEYGDCREGRGYKEIKW